MPVDIPDFPHDTPPNLRTKLPERPTSAGRTRPGMPLIARASSNTEVPASVGPGRRYSLPVIPRSKLPENSMKGRSTKNDQDTALLEIQKPIASDPGIRRASKPSLTESTGFGRTISKMSLDMALRHMVCSQQKSCFANRVPLQNACFLGSVLFVLDLHAILTACKNRLVVGDLLVS